MKVYPVLFAKLNLPKPTTWSFARNVAFPIIAPAGLQSIVATKRTSTAHLSSGPVKKQKPTPQRATSRRRASLKMRRSAPVALPEIRNSQKYALIAAMD